ncbi:MAG: S4 domain-containing protein, partial [Burkholderiaceae bacterium]
MSDDARVRVSKLLAERGICSRREADQYIEQGLVLLDGSPVTELGTRAHPSQTVALAKGAQLQQAQRLTVILHKPIGYVSHADDDGHYPPAVNLITPDREWVDPHNSRMPGHGRTPQAARATGRTSGRGTTAPAKLQTRGLAPAG